MIKKLRKLNESSSPMVATFWYIDGEFYGDEIPWREGDEWGYFIQSPEDHIDLWSDYRMLVPEFKNLDYTYYPRGRVMLNTKIKKYVVCCDKCLQTDEIKSKIISHFNLPRNGSVIWDTDSHYVCHNCSQS